MAESQEPIAYDGALLDALADSLSEPRLDPYVKAARGNRALDIKLYLWNSRLSKSFLFPLNVAEVMTRNAMHGALSTEFGGAEWIVQPPFPLTPESDASRQKALGRLNGKVTPDNLVAALTFDFWSNLFRREYRTLWDRPGLLARTFPHLPAGVDRIGVQAMVADINHFRNRIAHHEPIHGFNHREKLDRILELVGYTSPQTRGWVRSCSTVMAVARTPPTAGGGLPGLPLSSTNLRPPLDLTDGTSLDVALAELGEARPSVALVHGAEQPRVLLASQLMAYVATTAAKMDGMIDLAAHTLADVLASSVPVVSSRMDRSSSTGDALAAFFPAGVPQNERPQVLLVTSGAGIVGVLTHPVTRYV